jgi:predicted phosphodiesterase
MERIAVFADVHADEVALRSIIEAADAAGISRLWCLGDYCSGGPNPLACFELVRTHCELVLGGNHELFVIARVWETLENKGWVAAARLASWELGEERVKALQALPAHGEVAALGVEMVHGSLREPTHDFIRTAADAYMSIPLATQPIVLFGHTHIPSFFTSKVQGLPNEESIRLDVEYPLPLHHVYLLNPGSGCDEDGARWLELRIHGRDRSVIWHQTDVGGHGGIFSET